MCEGECLSSSASRVSSELKGSSGGRYQSPSRRGPKSVCIVVESRSAVVEFSRCVVAGAEVCRKSSTPPWFVVRGLGT